MTSDKELTKTTQVFLIIGLFIPGFTVIALLLINKLISLFGVACTSAWFIMWGIAIPAAFILPVGFYRYLKNTNHSSKEIKIRLVVFNVVEYTLIQAALEPFFGSAATLCYVSDGQNGLEMVFTGWLALPVLYVLTYVFQESYWGRGISKS